MQKSEFCKWMAFKWKCTRPSTCKFSHNRVLYEKYQTMLKAGSDPTRMPKIALCHQFQRGSCGMGDRCVYLHDQFAEVLRIEAEVHHQSPRA